MAKVICLSWPKGGSSKSTTCKTLSVFLSAKKYKILLMDLDPQGNLSQSILGKEKFKDISRNISDITDDDINIKDLIIKSDIEVLWEKNIDIIPWTKVWWGNSDKIVKEILSEINSKYYPSINMFESFFKEKIDLFKKAVVSGELDIDVKSEIEEFEKYLKLTSQIKDSIKDVSGLYEKYLKNLRKKLASIKNEYDYIIIDLNPYINSETKSAWIASDYIMVPLPNKFATDNVEDLLKEMVEIKWWYNEWVKFIFFFAKIPLFTNGFVRDWVQKHFDSLLSNFIKAINSNEYLSENTIIMDSIIRESLDFDKALNEWKTIFDYSHSKAHSDYVDFVNEFIIKTKNYGKN